MSIKISIFTFLILLGVSFSASANLYRVTKILMTNTCVSVGDVVTFDVLSGCSFQDEKWGKVYACNVSNGKFRCGRPTTLFVADIAYITTCENGYILNPDTGFCEPPPPFCEQSSTNDAIFSAGEACDAQGGVFSFQCSNGNDALGIPPSLDTTCNEPPDQCVMGFPNWPACMGDYDPTDPIDPPDGGFQNPDGSTSSSPDDEFNKPDIDDVQPNESTDTAVLEAVKNMNRDQNEALTQIKGHRILKTSLMTFEIPMRPLGKPLSTK